MIAPGKSQCVATARIRIRHAATQPNNPRFHSDTMTHFLFDLATNLAILAALLVACHLCNLARPDLALNGGAVYLVLASTALVFDAALTFLVFADARSRYGQFSTPSAFVERASAYLLACALAFYCAWRTHARNEKAKGDDVLVIRTSAYTDSHLPM
jgi:hypothetical protein